ncbi:MAG: aspartate dehydrogenase [Granulosicoccus sp.]
MNQILLVGYGAIGQFVFNSIQGCGHSSVKAVLCREGREVQARAALDKSITCINNASQVPADIDLVIECAGHTAVRNHIPVLLRCGKHVLCISNGALSDASLAAELEQAAVDGNSQLQFLSGAIGGMDMLAAAKTGGLESVCYRGIKPPAGWKGSSAEHIVDLDAIVEPVIHFKGTAREAARAFPKNANVAATVALAGIGFEQTRVELVADPTLSTNRHEVEAVGAFGRFTLSIDGNPLPGNPRSSALTAMSVLNAIENRNSLFTIG